jgi:hypothetical protein
MATETTKKIKNKSTKLFLAFMATAFSVPFITYDTGLRCIKAPCDGAAARGSLIEFFAKAHNLNAYVVDYTKFILFFVGIYILIELIDKFADR